MAGASLDEGFKAPSDALQFLYLVLDLLEPLLGSTLDTADVAICR